MYVNQYYGLLLLNFYNFDTPARCQYSKKILELISVLNVAYVLLQNAIITKEEVTLLLYINFLIVF